MLCWVLLHLIIGAALTTRGDEARGDFIELGGAGLEPGGGGTADWTGIFGNLGVDWPRGSSIRYVEGMGKYVVKNTQDNLAVFEDVLNQLDVVPNQIEIEARFVEVMQTDLDSLGFEWDLTDEEISEVVETLKSGWISVGPRVAQLEEEMAERQGTHHAIAVSSCTAALFLVAKALEIGPGDVAIVPSMTWPSTANVFEQLGASCAFADVDRRTGNITAETIAPLLDEHRGCVKIVVPV